MYKRLGIILLVSVLLIVSLNVISDRICLKNGVIRLHVVANSDSAQDQQVKLEVKDAVCVYLNSILKTVDSKEEASCEILKNISEIEEVANRALAASGSCDRAEVSLKEEAFEQRRYETFTLPAGVYDSLMIRIGNADGKNWWCVAFPTLCLSATSKEFEEDAVCAGMDPGLAAALSGQSNYKVRFYFLDCLGKLENFLFRKN